MTNRVLYLFPDTNIFIQCRALQELDWSKWAAFDEVVLCVSRPVQKEIDAQKNKGNRRLSQRARKASALFREVITGDDGHLIVNRQNPIVRLVIRTDLRPSDGCADQLAYDEADDRLVGTAFQYAVDNGSTEVRLLTHDTGPMASAKAIGLAFEVVPDDWLLPPEQSEAERKASQLQKEVERLTKTEPRFSVACVDGSGEEINSLDLAWTVYEPLTESRISDLLNELSQHFPKETEFGPRLSAARQSIKFVGNPLQGQEVFFPASDDEIVAYSDKHYPAWLDACEAVLRSCHKLTDRRQDFPAFNFIVENNGTRPADDALVTISVKGKLKIFVPTEATGTESNEQQNILPEPPKAPRGEWRFAPLGASSMMNSLYRMERQIAAIRGSSPKPYGPPLPKIDFGRRDANAFYYKPDRPVAPCSEFSLECKQWRHSIGAHDFTGNFVFKPSDEKASGVIACEIRASNMSNVASCQTPVEITVLRKSADVVAEQLVTALLNRAGIS